MRFLFIYLGEWKNKADDDVVVIIDPDFYFLKPLSRLFLNVAEDEVINGFYSIGAWHARSMTIYLFYSYHYYQSSQSSSFFIIKITILYHSVNSLFFSIILIMPNSNSIFILFLGKVGNTYSQALVDAMSAMCPRCEYMSTQEDETYWTGYNSHTHTHRYEG